MCEGEQTAWEGKERSSAVDEDWGCKAADGAMSHGCMLDVKKSALSDKTDEFADFSLHFWYVFGVYL